MNFAGKFLDKISSWIDTLMNDFGFYSNNWGKWIVMGFVLLMLSKVFKLNVKVGHKR